MVAAKGRGLGSISVIGITKLPFEAVLGERISKALKKVSIPCQFFFRLICH